MRWLTMASASGGITLSWNTTDTDICIMILCIGINCFLKVYTKHFKFHLSASYLTVTHTFCVWKRCETVPRLPTNLLLNDDTWNTTDTDGTSSRSSSGKSHSIHSRSSKNSRNDQSSLKSHWERKKPCKPTWQMNGQDSHAGDLKFKSHICQNSH